MKIIQVDQPTFQILDFVKHSTNEFATEMISNVHTVITVKGGEITEHDDGLDLWLISEQEKGMDEIYLYDIIESPLIYSPLSFEPTQHAIIRYFSRKRPENVINTKV